MTTGVLPKRAVSIFACLCFFIPAGSGLAQQTVPTDTSGQKRPDRASHALLFSIGPNFSFRSFQGTTFSYKNHLSEQKAIRLSLDLGFDFSSADNESIDISGYYRRETFEDMSEDSEDVGLNLYYLIYKQPRENVKFYAGGGPAADFFRYNRELDILVLEIYDIPGPDTIYSHEYQRSDYILQMAVGAGGLLGVEWQASKSIGFFAEYGIELQYYWNKVINQYVSDYDYGDDRTEEIEKGIRLTPARVKLGVAVYY